MKTLISGGICDGYFSKLLLKTKTAFSTKCPFLVIQINDIAGSHIDNPVLPNDIVRQKDIELMVEDVGEVEKL